MDPRERIGLDNSIFLGDRDHRRLLLSGHVVATCLHTAPPSPAPSLEADTLPAVAVVHGRRYHEEVIASLDVCRDGTDCILLLLLNFCHGHAQAVGGAGTPYLADHAVVLGEPPRGPIHVIDKVRQLRNAKEVIPNVGINQACCRIRSQVGVGLFEDRGCERAHLHWHAFDQIPERLLQDPELLHVLVRVRLARPLVRHEDDDHAWLVFNDGPEPHVKLMVPQFHQLQGILH
mmetsp:Transcript_64594/g.162550  ORF Transcript_64594/g.162550 Transcript_64594/m.162550 type:complete len:232 (-) Transcript_64594:138-833(-)